MAPHFQKQMSQKVGIFRIPERDVSPLLSEAQLVAVSAVPTVAAPTVALEIFRNFLREIECITIPSTKDTR